jgi:uncharacterized protein (TIGR02594 family)
MSENILKQLKALRAQVRSYQDTLEHYEKLFKADGVIDATERKQLDKLNAAIGKIKDNISKREEKLNFGGNVKNTVSGVTESVSDFLSKEDDQVNHSLVNTDKIEETPTDDTTATETPTDDTTTTPSGEEDKYAAIAETPAVKEFLKGIHSSEGGYVDDANDPGGKTKYGIAEKREWPAFAKMFGLDAGTPALIKDITKKQVDEYYIKTRFEQNGLDKISSTKVINAIFDQSILTPGIVKKNMKKALVALDSNNKFPINNSEFSAAEITAINGSNADKLVEKFVEYQNDYYNGLVKKNPGKFKKYINGWLNRTARLTGFSGGTDEDTPNDSGNTSTSDSGDLFEVPSGWGLNKIASEKGVTLEQLKEWNADKLKTYKNGSQGFNVGEMIVVKGGSSSGSSDSGDLFEVPSGWGLNKIASEKGVTVEELKGWNADKLKTYKNGSQGFNVGEMIVVAGGGSVSSETTNDDEPNGDDDDVSTGGYVKPSWLKEAEKYLGKKETAKMVKDDPWVKLLFEELGGGAYGWAKTQTVNSANWCAAFVSYCLKQTGQSPLTGFDGMRARTYGEKYGKEVTRPVYGALVSVARGGAGHIGIVVGYDKKTKVLTILGGNQGNKVSIKKEKREVLAYRVPSGWKIPEQNYLD